METHSPRLSKVWGRDLMQQNRIFKPGAGIPAIHFLSSDEGENGNFGSLAFMLKNAGAFVGCCSSGEDVVNQDDLGSSDSVKVPSLESKCSPEVRESLLSTKLGLSAGGANTLQGIRQRESRQF